MNRDELWAEAVRFCEYVDEYFSKIHSVWVFGSYLWKDDPGDMDVYLDCEDDLIVGLSYAGFPNIHLTNSQDQTKNKVLIWRKDSGMLEYDFGDRVWLMMDEILMLREQIEELHMKARTPPRRFRHMEVEE